MRANSNTLHRARQLRKRMTLPEVCLWTAFRGRQPGKPVFRRQHPMGPYVLDFYCSAARLCVEVDGYSHRTAEQLKADARRDAFLRDAGVRIVRIDASHVLADPSAVAHGLLELAMRRSTPTTASRSPSPAARGRN